MSTALQIGNQTLNSEDLIPLLARYQLLPQLQREILIDQAIATFPCTPEEIAIACQHFYNQQQITTATEQQAWLKRHNMQPAELEAIATRKSRIEKFKRATWDNKLESYFLKRKGQLDQAIYSLIRIQDAGIAQELYFRLQAQEQPFAELAETYSLGSEARSGGKVGPSELGTLHPQLARMLRVSQPGQLWQPTRLGEWFVIVQLEQIVPAQLNDLMRQRLLNELFETWIQAQLGQVAEHAPLAQAA
ncbi:peptidylprolyl isomerase [Pantanalinema sp. GBBB05]|uniref:peptidylprolyl isomerase n=1 Tax=Pantanalinema sp. GBBB05 TaxID=2604139 RepID=UPI001D1D4B4C|nr:peptidylprolyl isomerase [Pantanalinema sp. GBBB05]